MEKLHAVIGLLRTHQPLPRSHKDHVLKGEWKGYRECHVGGEGDWLLVYIQGAGKLILFRTGKHEEIF
jgi:mRNA interferase YafQ